MDDPQIHNLSEFFLSQDDYENIRQTCPKSGKEAQCETIYPVIVNKCWDGLGWLNGKKDGYHVKFILFMFKLYNKWGSLIMKIIWYVINGDQYASYVTYLPFIPIRSRE